MDTRYQVKQFVATVQNARGGKFMVFRTGDDRWYLFSCLSPDGMYATGLQFPVEKKRLRADWRSMLNHGMGNFTPGEA